MYILEFYIYVSDKILFVSLPSVRNICFIFFTHGLMSIHMSICWSGGRQLKRREISRRVNATSVGVNGIIHECI